MSSKTFKQQLVGEPNLVKKENAAFWKGALTGFLACGAGVALYNFATTEAPQAPEVEFDAQGNPMFLLDDDYFDSPLVAAEPA